MSFINRISVPGMMKENVLNQLQQCIDKVENGKFELEMISWNEPHAIDPNNELVHSIINNSKEVLGFEPKPFGMGGGTFAKTLNLKGVISVGWGPGDDEAFHVANEYVEIQQLVDFSLLTCMVSLDLLS